MYQVSLLSRACISLSMVACHPGCAAASARVMASAMLMTEVHVATSTNFTCGMQKLVSVEKQKH